MSWRGVIAVVASSQSSSDEQQEELLSVSDTEEMHQSQAFWVHLLKMHCSDMDTPTRVSPIKLVSCCTGSFAEASVLKD